MKSTLATAVAVVAMIGGAVGLGVALGSPKLTPVTEAQLLAYRGIDYKHGNALKSIRLMDQSNVHGGFTTFFGSGGGSVSTDSSQVLMLGVEMDGAIQFIYLKGFPVSIGAGSDRLIYHVSTPNKVLYHHPVKGSFTHDQNAEDSEHFHRMDVPTLMQKLAHVQIILNQKTFNRVFGGVN